MSIHNRVLFSLCIGFFVAGTTFSGDIKSSGKKGAWGADSTWIGGVVPGASDTVTIADGDSVTFNVDSVVVKSITVGEGMSGALLFTKTDSIRVWVNGDLLIKNGGVFKAQTHTLGAGKNLVHTLYLYGNLTHNGSVFDLRTGSANTNLGCVNIALLGSADQTLTISTTFSTSNGEFNGIRVSKTGSGRVVLSSDIQLAGGSSAAPLTFPELKLERGKIFTGNYALIHRYGASTGSVVGGSDSSYIVGAMGRGMANSSGTSRDFPVGDSLAYRPVNVRSTTGGSATGHYISVRVIKGNANSGSSTFAGGIDKVSAVRYYEVKYVQQGGAATMGVNRFKLSYGTDDGVGTGNNDLRVAFSKNDRGLWTSGPQVIPDTTYTPDAAIQDSIAADTLSNNEVNLLALARVTGTTTNTLSPSTSVERISDFVPSEFMVSQNYPNPFNPGTTIRFYLDRAQHVWLRVYDYLGREIETLVDSRLGSGSYEAVWNAGQRASGVYFYTIQAGQFQEAKKMLLLK